MEPLPPQKDKVFCFLDQARFCGPDCIAYKTIPDALGVNPSPLDSAQMNCVLICSAERVGIYAGMLASSANNALKQQAVRDADAKRGGPPSPPNPLGGTR